MAFNKLSEISHTPEDSRTYEGDPTLPLPINKVGIEIEIEKVDQDTLYKIATSGYWKTDHEPSLRGHDSGELISVPIFGKDIDLALEVLEREFKKVHKPAFNKRTSLHIHVEVVDMTKEELIRFIVLYCAFERILFRMCDETRQNNPYCLPTWMSEATKQDIARLITFIEDGQKRHVKSMIGQWPKYCAMNLNNIVGIGTIEFRQHHGTVNIKEIKTWIRVLLSLKRHATVAMTKYNDFPEVVSGFMPQEYLIAVFGEELAAELVQTSLADDLLKGVRCAQDILLYRRLGKATEIIYGKQSGDQPSSFSRIFNKEVTIDPYKMSINKQYLSSSLNEPSEWHPENMIIDDDEMEADW